MPSPDTSTPSPAVAESALPAATETKAAESASSASRSPQAVVSPIANRAAVEEAVRLYAEGKSMGQIASATGVPAATIMRWMLADLGPEFERLRETAVIAKAIENYEKLEKAETYLEIMRAGQLTKHWNWMLERLVRHRFGPSLDVNAKITMEPIDAAETARRMAFLLARGAQTVDGVATVVPEALPESVSDVDDERRLDG